MSNVPHLTVRIEVHV